MIPNPDQALADLAMKLATSIVPDIQSSYGQSNAGMISMLLLALAKETRQGLDARLQDIEELQSLLSHPAAAGAPDGAARAEFRAARPASFQLSDVDALHAHGMALLIVAHEWAEAHEPALDREIWAFLGRTTQRHRYEF